MAVADSDSANSADEGRVRYRPGIFTSVNLLLGILAYSLLPLLASSPAIHAHRLTAAGLQLVIAEVVALQMALWFAVRRCGSEELPFWQGVALVARYMKTGWIYTDMVMGGIGVLLFLVIADVIAFTPNPRLFYYRVLHRFYRIRLVQ